MRSNLLLFVILFLAALLLVGCSSPADAPATNSPNQNAADAGKETWSSLTCAGCHGNSGEGGRAPALAGTMLDEQAFVDIVRNGQGRMPGFGASQVSDDDLAQVYSWLVSLAE